MLDKLEGRCQQIQINQCMPNVIDVGNDGDFVDLESWVQDLEPASELATNGGM